MTPDQEKLAWYKLRVHALERLLAHYRAQTQPSEKLHLELEASRKHIDSNGMWRE